MRKILILSASPEGADRRIRLDAEKCVINEVLKKKASQRDEFEIVFEEAVHTKSLQYSIETAKPQIVHFCGHGNEGGISIEGGRVSVDALAELLGLCRRSFPLHCVLLNACCSETLMRAIHEHIDCVIGMKQAISDEAAIAFARGFYTALGEGLDYDDAFARGRNQIRIEEFPEWGTPKLLYNKRPSLDESQTRENLATINSSGYQSETNFLEHGNLESKSEKLETQSEDIQEQNFRQLNQDQSIQQSQWQFTSFSKFLRNCIFLMIFISFIIIIGTSFFRKSQPGLKSVVCKKVSNDITTMSFVEGGKYLVTGDSEGNIKKLKTESICSNQPVLLWKQQDVVTAVKPNPKRPQVATASLDGTVFLTNNFDKKNYVSLLGGNKAPVTSIDFSPDGNYLATSTDNGAIRIWDTNSYQKIAEQPSDNHYMMSVSFSPNGQYLVSNSLDTPPKIWRWHNNKLQFMENQKILQSNPKIISFSPEENFLAISYSEGILEILELKDSELKKVASLDIEDEIKEIRFSSNAKILAILGFDLSRGVQLWKWKNKNTQRLLNTLGADGVSSLEFSPDGRLLALALKEEIQVWETETYTLLNSFAVAGEPVKIAFEIKKNRGEKEISFVVANTDGEVFRENILVE